MEGYYQEMGTGRATNSRPMGRIGGRHLYHGETDIQTEITGGENGQKMEEMDKVR